MKDLDYFLNKKGINYTGNFVAQFTMPSIFDEILKVNLWMKGHKDRTVFTMEAPYSRAIHQNSVPESLYHQPLPTLVVRQNGEARTRPFVAIIDPFNEGETSHVKNVNYFSDENEDFIGITVQSGNGRKDHIYNDINSDRMHSFSNGSFVGNYAIITVEGEDVKSMLLTNGKILHYGLWKIEAGSKDAAVLVLFQGNKIMVNANRPFKLTLPWSGKKKDQVMLEAIDALEHQAFSAKIQKRKRQKFVEFDLPALNNATMKIIH